MIDVDSDVRALLREVVDEWMAERHRNGFDSWTDSMLRARAALASQPETLDVERLARAVARTTICYHAGAGRECPRPVYYHEHIAAAIAREYDRLGAEK